MFLTLPDYIIGHDDGAALLVVRGELNLFWVSGC
jgi:hypothetical protein